MTDKRQWVGVRVGDYRYERFTSEDTPTAGTHGHLYIAAIGPFRTVRGAKYMAAYGRGNPHLQHVNDAERIASTERRVPVHQCDQFNPSDDMSACAVCDQHTAKLEMETTSG